MTKRQTSRRSGFTLVELLMVIVIIGMLAGLITAAAVRAIGTAKNTQITTEISLLDAAMQTYKNDTGGAYPPDCSLLIATAGGATPSSTATPAAQDTTNRQNRILAHLRKAFPRLIIASGYGPASQPGTLQYMSQAAFSKNQTYPQVANGTSTAGGAVYGNFDNMDPAEAFVFFLGGFAVPMPPDSSGKILYKLIGFSANKVGNASSAGPNANGPNSGFGPFNLDVQSRDPGPFEFNQGRLGDADGDGWVEYYPPNATVPQPPGSAAAVSTPTPPYVYFDAVSYGTYTTATVATNDQAFYPASAAYPSASGTGLQPTTVGASWLVAVPYVQNIASNGTITWQNPQKFQLVAGGLDQMYFFNQSGFLIPNALRGFAYNGTTSTWGQTGYSQGDLDNLTNFTTGVLQP